MPSPSSPGARTDPVQSRTAEQRGEDRGGNRGVSDPHLADAEKIGATRHRLHAEGHRPRAVGLLHRRLARDVAGRDVEGEVQHLEAEVVGEADLVDGCAAAGEILDHLPGHLGGISRDTLGRHPMISGEDRHHRPVDRRRRPALPGGEPGRDLLEAAERAGRLGEDGVARLDRLDGPEVGSGHAGHKVADVVERYGRGRGHVGGRLFG